MVVGLVLDRDGFPKAHEVFDGNRPDVTTLEEMLDSLQKRTGSKVGTTVILDWGLSSEDNLALLGSRRLHYVVGGRPGERDAWWEDFEREEDGQEVVRSPSSWNLNQRKTRVWIKLRKKGEQTYILCLSEGRPEKDRALRLKQEQRLLAHLERLRKRVEKGRLKQSEKIHQANRQAQGALSAGSSLL